jgi:glycosyltransferase involved in cell wall biosynthesis
MPKITVIIPTKNRPDNLRAALRSLSAQMYRDFEVLVINDGGEPLSAERPSWPADISVRLLERPLSGGPAAARNEGLKASSGAFVAFLDDDDIFLPTHLSDAIAALDSGAVDFAYSGALISPRRLTGLADAGADCVPINHDFEPGFLQVACYIPMSSIVCRNPRQVDALFDENLIVCEDWEFWVRLLVRHGYSFAHIPNITSVYHRVADLGNTTFNSNMLVSGYQKFVDAWRQVVAAYPSDDPLVSRYRTYITRYHEMSLERIQSGQPLAHFNYEHYTEDLITCFRRGAAVPDLDQRVLRAIIGR